MELGVLCVIFTAISLGFCLAGIALNNDNKLITILLVVVLSTLLIVQSARMFG